MKSEDLKRMKERVEEELGSELYWSEIFAGRSEISDDHVRGSGWLPTGEPVRVKLHHRKMEYSVLVGDGKWAEPRPISI